MEQSKVYRVVDDGIVILTTTDRIKAALSIMTLAQKYEEKQNWFWCDTENLQ